MKYLVTGGAGFIGFHTSKRLLALGHEVTIIDNFNNYYEVRFKEMRASQLSGAKIIRADISDYASIKKLFEKEKFNKVIHLAAQAGVRYSLTNPFTYVESNVKGTLNIFEACRHNKVKDIVYASSSSVYGGNKKIPFSEKDPVDKPISLYAQTKRDNELMAYAYHHLYGLNMTGLRFFTVYGPYGRPDMAAWIFAKNILEGKPIDVFNKGKMKRDFTFVEDIADGVINASDKSLPYEIFNLGNNKPVELAYFIRLIEKNIGKEAKKNLLPMQPGDVAATWADIRKAKKILGWQPKTSIEEGIGLFIKWFKENQGV